VLDQKLKFLEDFVKNLIYKNYCLKQIKIKQKSRKGLLVFHTFQINYSFSVYKNELILRLGLNDESFNKILF